MYFLAATPGCPDAEKNKIFSNGAFITGMDLGPLLKKKREETTRFKTTSRGLRESPRATIHMASLVLVVKYES